MKKELELTPLTIIPVHRHRESEERISVLRGSVIVVFYSDSGAQSARHRLDDKSADRNIIIPAGQWYTIEVPEASTVVVERDGSDAPLNPEDVMY